MISEEELKPILLDSPNSYSTAEHVSSGLPILKQSRIRIFSPDAWELFTHECISSLEDYDHVRRHTGSGDQGIDVAGFASNSGWDGGWDNYQCKHYSHPLRPADIWVEIGKIIYYSYEGEYPPPRKYYFIAPQDIGTKLAKLLEAPSRLKEETKDNWEKHCQNNITRTANILLEGDLLDWFEEFDFSIFSTIPVVKLLEIHATTPFHAITFGGELPPRPLVPPPPESHDTAESHYIRQLYKAYEDHLGIAINDCSDLDSSSKPGLKRDLSRQRERFYYAEYLRNYARDTVPNGTFERLQEEIYYGAVDVHDSDHVDGLARMRATVIQAAHIATTSNPLASVVQTQDKQGICHQLANEDRFVWVETDKEE